MERFTDRVAVVTGAGSGIGFALCSRFVSLGMRVVAADVDAPALEAAAARLGARVIAVPTDVADPAAVQALAEVAYSRCGAVHLLCNNAGVTVRTSLLDATRDDWEWVLGVNLWGVLHGIEAFVPRMVDAGDEGHVLNTCSMASFLSASRYGIYCATKHAVAAVTEALAGDLAEVGAPIGVTGVCPSAVATQFANAARTRPERHGGPQVSGAGADERARIEAAYASAQSADEVAAAAIDGIRRRELFVFPDAEAKAPALSRMERILR